MQGDVIFIKTTAVVVDRKRVFLQKLAFHTIRSYLNMVQSKQEITPTRS